MQTDTMSWNEQQIALNIPPFSGTRLERLLHLMDQARAEGGIEGYELRAWTLGLRTGYLTDYLLEDLR